MSTCTSQPWPAFGHCIRCWCLVASSPWPATARRHGWGKPPRSKPISARSGNPCRVFRSCPIRSGPAAISSRNSHAMTKVLLFTSQDIGNDVFAYLHPRDDIDLVVVPQRPRRDEIYGYRATLDLCVEKGVEVHTPKA